ncbi:hypothetical protein COHA_007530 [Chlorella ohadii]|uniref:Rubisco LSMT substrate-binding domain-containing protein n=1 Tax=Chlorella ohadii TaxID=2649997 RepID=A0AAD5DLP0_9CHLO|nr:hypothetical protein COHA_007530 [Chlorella ohadii]
MMAAPPTSTTGQRPSKLLNWLEASGAPAQKVSLATVDREGIEVDVTVATEPLAPGDIALAVPEHLIVSRWWLAVAVRGVAELALLTLYLAYEKKRGKEGCFYPFIRELDRMQGRGSQGAKSPLLWEEGQVEELLAGSPVVGEIQERLRGISKEFEELDTVWYLAGSLFNRQPFAPPTEQFSLKVFTQAFTAVQSSVVHLLGVPLGRRFALVPLGPPLLTYSSTSKAMLKYDPETRQVQLAVDRAYQPGEPVLAWCGPQPNSKLLINYGIVDESNPHDRLPLSFTIPSSDPLYRQKRDVLAQHDLSTQQTFQLQRSAPLPPQLLPYLRVVFATRAEDIAAARFGEDAAPLIHLLRRRQAAYRTTIEQDDAIIADPTTGPRQTVAARLLRIEKQILAGATQAALALPGAAEAAALGPLPTAVKME